MKKYIIFALLLFACFRANAFEWNTYTININCEPTGAGKVYADDSSTENNNNYQDAPYSTTIYSNQIYAFAKPAASNYKFLRWEVTESGNTSTNKTYQLQSADFEDQNWGLLNFHTANLTAVFEDLSDIAVMTNNALLGQVSSTFVYQRTRKGENVTITATPAGNGVIFRGWIKDGGSTYVSTNQNYTFTFTDNTKGTYTAVFEAQSASLAQATANGANNEFFNLTDLTCVTMLPNYKDGYYSFFCKDNNGFANKDVKGDGEVDYVLLSSALSKERYDHDQSNWIAINIPAAYVPSMAAATALVGKTISAGAEGRLTRDGRNLELEIAELPTAGTGNTYKLNTYIPSNFLGTQYSTIANRTYFFITPKPMEITHISWAMYDGSKFVVIPKVGATINEANLQGEFVFNDMIYQNDDNPVRLRENAVYEFKALIKDNSGSSNAPGRKAAAGNSFVVYPIEMPQEIGSYSHGIVTNVVDVNTDDVATTTYYNLQGIQIDQPQPGDVVIEKNTLKNGKTTARAIRK